MPNSTASEDLYEIISDLDSVVFKAYNTCNLADFGNYFVDDLEFYHDKSGMISSRKTMLEALEVVLCGDKNVRTRRVLIKDSLQVYPLHNFGAIQMGEHQYYKSFNGQPEELVEVAKFTHIWKHEGNDWKITRVLSYDHQPVNL
ncbi:MAG TPA: nuclear transport factor 2 family protein [Cyclobacteriaceae bacterium]|nr:nuclear transport factor 2 family protein [Cyclobacteriaceae bacterium]